MRRNGRILILSTLNNSPPIFEATPTATLDAVRARYLRLLLKQMRSRP